MVKNPPAMRETWVEKSRGGGRGNPLQYSCLENPHGQRSLAGYSPWGCKESDTTEQLRTHTHTFPKIVTVHHEEKSEGDEQGEKKEEWTTSSR